MLPVLHFTRAADVTLVGHLASEHLLENTVVGVVVALCLFALYYKLILVRARDGPRNRRSNDGPPENTGN